MHGIATGGARHQRRRQSVVIASVAIKELNGQKLLNRTIAVDWSLPKNEYQQKQGASNAGRARAAKEDDSEEEEEEEYQN